jgi:BlaI family transcriptional regulator, penicillinase repressor
MEQIASPHRGAGPRHSILDLAPLELECMSVLWPLGEGTVRDIHRQLAASRPRAYTTIMTIMDRLAHKGIVTRRRVGRAYRYQANLSADEARVSAIEKIVTGFFDGSPEALAAHLAAAGRATRTSIPASPQLVPPRREARFTANEAPPRERPNPPESSRQVPIDRTDTADEESLTPQLDETLL